MNVNYLYDSLQEVQIITNEQRELLDAMMGLNSPLDFTDDFANDEVLDQLEDAMDRAEISTPASIELKATIIRIKPKISDNQDFI